MKTKLPPKINSVDEAKALLTALYENKESFHPDDDANELVGDPFTKVEGDKLNTLLEQMFVLDGFDPNDFTFNLMYVHVLESHGRYLTKPSKNGDAQWVKDIEHAWVLSEKALETFYKEEKFKEYHNYLNAIPRNENPRKRNP